MSPHARSWRDLIEEGRKLVNTDGGYKRKLGNLALEVDDEKFERFADEIGMDARELRVLRRVAAAYPGKLWCQSASWQVHHDLAGREDRHDILAKLSRGGRRVTLTAARQAIGGSTLGRPTRGDAPVLKAAQARSVLSEDEVAESLDLDTRTAERVVKRIAQDHPTVVARHGRKAIEDENRRTFERVRSERRAAGEPTTQARDLLGGRRPYMEAMSALHSVRTGTRRLGHLRDDLTDDERADVISNLDDALHFLGMVADLYRSKANLDSELAAFLASEGDDD